jgi:hypothetical protein
VVTSKNAGGDQVTRSRLAAAGLAAAIALLGAACTSHASRGQVANGRSSAPGMTRAELARQGWLVPATYQQACAAEVSICGHVPAGPVPSVLSRPLHFPVLRPGQGCPATPGHPLHTSLFSGTALGTGQVRVMVESQAGAARRGIAKLLTHTSAPGWYGFKTLWFSVPSYQGPFVIRATRLGAPGPIAMGEAPRLGPLVVPPGAVMNEAGGYRQAPGGTWVKSPGCYAWQVDGLTFSDIIVVRAVLH